MTEIELLIEEILKNHVAATELRDVYFAGSNASHKIFGKNFGDLTPEQRKKLKLPNRE